MEVIRKYTAIIIKTAEFNNEVILANASFGSIQGPYYDEKFPIIEHETEEEAIKYAYEQDQWANWMIIPVVKFKTF